jgi:hypothetical protein
MTLPVYIGYDSREPQSYQVAERSLRRHASQPLLVTPLILTKLAEGGLLRRPQDLRGQRYDILSNAAASTEFAISRFLVPLLAQTGWALFVDSDVVFMGDVAELFRVADSKYAVQVVKHDYQPADANKMDGQRNLAYGRKNWSSVILWNCDHPANKRLSLSDVQERRGLDLHQFYWLNEAEIGHLPREWNWLVEVQEKPPAPKIAHFTLGTPEVGVMGEYSDLWLKESA